MTVYASKSSLILRCPYYWTFSSFQASIICAPELLRSISKCHLSSWYCTLTTSPKTLITLVFSLSRMKICTKDTSSELPNYVSIIRRSSRHSEDCPSFIRHHLENFFLIFLSPPPIPKCVQWFISRWSHLFGTVLAVRVDIWLRKRTNVSRLVNNSSEKKPTWCQKQSSTYYLSFCDSKNAVSSIQFFQDYWIRILFQGFQSFL